MLSVCVFQNKQPKQALAKMQYQAPNSISLAFMRFCISDACFG